MRPPGGTHEHESSSARMRFISLLRGLGDCSAAEERSPTGDATNRLLR